MKATVSIILVQNILSLMALEASLKISYRLPNQKRKRDHFEDIVSAFSDAEFMSFTGLSREVFNYLLYKLIELDYQKDYILCSQAKRSSGSPITLACKLYIHQ